MKKTECEWNDETEKGERKKEGDTNGWRVERNSGNELKEWIGVEKEFFHKTPGGLLRLLVC